MAWPGRPGRTLGGADCESFGAEGEGEPPLATKLGFLNSAERSEELQERPGAPAFCLPAKDGRKPKLCDAALKGLVIDRMCSSGWGGAAGWGLGPAAGRNQKEEKRKPLPLIIANAGRGKLVRKGGKGGL